MVLWMSSIAISVCLLTLTAATGDTTPMMASAHSIVAALVSVVMALLAISETRKLIQSGATDMTIAGSLMRFMGLIWAWLALVVSVTYGTGILEWSAWWQYFIAFMVFSGLSLFVSRLLCEAHQRVGGDIDEPLFRTSQYIACTTLFVTVTAMAVYGINRINSAPVAEVDIWAADNAFVFGALALAAISSYMLKAGVRQAH